MWVPLLHPINSYGTAAVHTPAAHMPAVQTPAVNSPYLDDGGCQYVVVAPGAVVHRQLPVVGGGGAQEGVLGHSDTRGQNGRDLFGFGVRVHGCKGGWAKEG